MKRLVVTVAIGLLATVFFASCNSASKPTAENPVPGKIIKSGPIGDKLMVTLSNDTGRLKSGEQEIGLTFTDTSGKVHRCWDGFSRGSQFQDAGDGFYVADE